MAVGVIVLGVAAVGGWVIQASHRHGSYYRLLYMVAAKNVTDGAGTPAEQVDRLSKYVFMNVRVPDDAPLDENGSPAETLIWGYGYSDQQVRLFMKLALEDGLSSRELFLIRPADGSSPHTVAEVEEDGRWNLVDVEYGYVAKRANGSPATTAEAVSSSSEYLRLQERVAGLQPGDYSDGKVALEYTPGKLTAATRLIGRLMPHWLADRIQDLYLRMPPPVIAKPEGFSRFQGFSSADGQLYWRARNHQLINRLELATTEYQRLLEQFPNSSYANDARYYLALMASSSSPSQAIQAVNDLASHNPLPAVMSDADWIAARSYEALGGQANCATARSLYQSVASQQVPAATAASFRLNSLQCPAA